MLWDCWFNRIQWRMVARCGINPKNLYYAIASIAVQVTALAGDIDENTRLEAEQTLIFKMYPCLGRTNFTKPHLDLGTTNFSRVLDAIETEVKNERSEMYENTKWREQHIGEPLKQWNGGAQAVYLRQWTSGLNWTGSNMQLWDI